MTVETRKLEIKNVFNNWNMKRFSDFDVLEVTKKWRTIKCNKHKTYRFGSNRSAI